MKWTEGHIWVYKDLLIKTKTYFNYKYVLMKDAQPLNWERGENRIADMRYLQEITQSYDDILLSKMGIFKEKQNYLQELNSEERSKIKKVEIFDEWEKFILKFSIFIPINDENDNLIKVDFPLQELGLNKKPIILQKITQNDQKNWLINKYGNFVKPYECQIDFKNDLKDFQEFPKIINYSYQLVNEKLNNIQNERNEKRTLEIQKPQTYKGIQNLVDPSKVWIINGIIDKKDGNFLGSKFQFNKVYESLHIGSYPQNENDINSLKNVGITTIINLLTQQETKSLNINEKDIQLICESKGISQINIPLKDILLDEYCFDLFNITKTIHEIIDIKKQKIFVYCSSGVSRSPTLIMVYLCLLKKIEQWNNPYGCLSYLKSIINNIYPNMQAIEQTLKQNKTFQQKQNPRITSFKDDQSIASQSRNSQISNNKYDIQSKKKMKQLNSIQQTQLLYETSSAVGEMIEEDIKISQRIPAHNQNSNNTKGQASNNKLYSLGKNAAKSQISSAPWDNEVSFSKDLEENINEKNENQIKNKGLNINSASLWMNAAQDLAKKLTSEEQEKNLKQLEKIEQDNKIQLEQKKLREFNESIIKQKEILMIQEQKLQEERKIAEDLRQKMEKTLKLQEEAEKAKEEANKKLKIKEEMLEKQAELQKIMEQEILIQQQQEVLHLQKQIEQQLRNEMEQKIIQQKLETERLLQEKEEIKKIELEKFQKQEWELQKVLTEKLRLKELKNQKKAEINAQKSQEFIQQQKLQEELNNQRNEMENLKQKLKQEQLFRQNIEDERILQNKQLKEELEQQKMQLKKEKEQNESIQTEKSRAEHSEIEKLRQIQQLLIATAEKKKKQKEQKKLKRALILQQIDQEKQQEEEESRRVNQEIQRKRQKSVSIIDQNSLNSTPKKSQVQKISYDYINVNNEENNSNDKQIEQKYIENLQLSDAKTFQKFNYQNNQFDIPQLFASDDLKSLTSEIIPKQSKKNNVELQNPQNYQKHIEKENQIQDSQKYLNIMENETILNGQQSYIEQLSQIVIAQKEAELQAKYEQFLKLQKCQEEANKQANDETNKKILEQQQNVQELLKQEQIKREESEKLAQINFREKEIQIENLKAQLSMQISKQKQEEQQKIEEMKKIEELIRIQTEMTEEKKNLFEKQKQYEIQKETELQKQIKIEKQRQIEIQQEMRENIEKEMREKIEKEIKEQIAKEKLERERMSQIAKEAEESAQRLKEEIQKLEQQKLEIYKRNVADQASAKIIGELIIRTVEKQIQEIFCEIQNSNEFKQPEEQINIQNQDSFEKNNEIDSQINIFIQKYQKEKSAEKVQISNEKKQIQEMKYLPFNKTGKIESKLLQKNKDDILLNIQKGSQLEQLANSFEISIHQEDVISKDQTYLLALKSSENFDKQLQLFEQQLSLKFYSPEMNSNQINHQIDKEQEQQKEEINKKDQLDKQIQDVPQIITIDIDLVQDINQYLQNIFNSAPIPFNTRKNNKLDEQIRIVIDKYDIRIPIINIKNQLYLIGTHRVNCDFKYDQVLVKKGGGSQRIEIYLQKFEEQMQSQLIDAMIRTRQDLIWVLEQLIEGKNILSLCSDTAQYKLQNSQKQQQYQESIISFKKTDIQQAFSPILKSKQTPSPLKNKYQGNLSAASNNDHSPKNKSNVSPLKLTQIQNLQSPLKFSNIKPYVRK